MNNTNTDIINNNDNNWITLGSKAEQYIQSGDIDTAKQLLLSCISLKPTEAWPYLLLSSIVQNNGEAIRLIASTKDIEMTPWYYISLIEKYTLEIDILRKEFVDKYNPNTLNDDGAVIHWRQLMGFADFTLPKSDISVDDLGIIHNQWECIAILCTGKEYLNDLYIQFLHNIYNTIDTEIAKNLHLKLIIKSSDNQRYRIPKFFSNLFASTDIISIDLIDKLDIYDNKQDIQHGTSIIKQYGSKYGPNFVFFETMKHLSRYNTSLLLECDCVVFPDWMARINNYINSQSFLISGSQSDSPNNENLNHVRNQHINGGTAIYATGSVLFQKFIRLCEQLWPIYIENKSVDLPYDYILLFVIKNYFNSLLNNQKDKIIWSYIKKHYIYNTLISNWSDTTYADYDPHVVSQRTQTAILHQKPMGYP